MAGHQHKFVANPITGKNACSGREDLLGWRIHCQHCYNEPKAGDIIEEIKSSHWRELIPKSKPVNIAVTIK